MGKSSGGGSNIANIFTKGIIDNGIQPGFISQKQEPLPALDPVAVETPQMPTQDSEAVKSARQARALALARRSGRASTILTNQDYGNKLGG